MLGIKPNVIRRKYSPKFRVNIEKVKTLLVRLLNVATAVAASGTIGFVGLIFCGVRLVVGPDH